MSFIEKHIIWIIRKTKGDETVKKVDIKHYMRTAAIYVFRRNYVGMEVSESRKF